MHESDTRNLESPARADVSHLTCSTCDEGIVAIETRGPGHHVAVPCGHRPSLTTRDFAETDTDEPPLRTDGGTDPLTRARQRLTRAVTHSYAGRATEARAAIREAMAFLDGARDETLTTDGGLPETFATFADPDAERVCESCGDAVAPKYLHDGRCVGCRYREGDARATPEGELVTDGGQVRTRDRTDPARQWHGLRAFQRDCLVAIAELGRETPPSGREIQKRLGRWYAEDVHHSQLYTNLDALVEAGLLEKTERDGRTNGYALTDAGREALAAGRDQLASAVTGGADR